MEQYDEFLSLKPYEVPLWATRLSPGPSHTYSLGRYPTPIHQWNLPNLPNGTEVWIKREDLSGMQMSGNKARKLEFLMAQAVADGADCIVTIGSVQSNSCRAAAVAANYLNLDCYLILHTAQPVDEDPGFTGNLLVTRLVGPQLYLVSSQDYVDIGSEVLLNCIKQILINDGRRPYIIPPGGSSPLGVWGYIDSVREIEQQHEQSGSKKKFDEIVVACGSASTVTGLAVGSWFSSLKANVTGYSISNDPEYYYGYIQGLLDGINAGVQARDIVTIKDAKGNGYGETTPEELAFIKQVSETTGVILDHVYSGKAAYGMMKDMHENPTNWEGKKVLFIHTGGLLGLYSLIDQLAPPKDVPYTLFDRPSKCHTMPIDDSMPRIPGIGKMV